MSFFKDPFAENKPESKKDSEKKAQSFPLQAAKVRRKTVPHFKKDTLNENLPTVVEEDILESDSTCSNESSESVKSTKNKKKKNKSSRRQTAIANINNNVTQSTVSTEQVHQEPEEVKVVNKVKQIGKLPQPTPEIAKDWLKKLNALGYKAYIVGGTPRDILLNKPLKNDFDIVTDAPIKTLQKLIYKSTQQQVQPNPFVENLFQFTEKGSAFDIRCVNKLDEEGIAVDAQSRDFTINAFYADAEDNCWDGTGQGFTDLHSQAQLKTITAAEKLFSENVKSLFRYIYLISQGFSGEYSTEFIKKHLVNLARRIATLTEQGKKAKTIDERITIAEEKVQLTEDITQSLYKILNVENPVTSFQKLINHGFFAAFYPGVPLVTNSPKDWMTWKISEITKYKFKEQFLRQLYKIFIASYLSDSANDYKIENCMKNNLVPAKYSKDKEWCKELKTAINEKNKFCSLPSLQKRALYSLPQVNQPTVTPLLQSSIFSQSTQQTTEVARMERSAIRGF